MQEEEENENQLLSPGRNRNRNNVFIVTPSKKDRHVIAVIDDANSHPRVRLNFPYTGCPEGVAVAVENIVYENSRTRKYRIRKSYALTYKLLLRYFLVRGFSQTMFSAATATLPEVPLHPSYYENCLKCRKL